jgi:hypothetical protein
MRSASVVTVLLVFWSAKAAALAKRLNLLQLPEHSDATLVYYAARPCWRRC